MKLFKSLALALVVASVPFTSALAIGVNIDGEPLKMDTTPVVQEGSTLVPMRAIFEALGMSVEWDDQTKTVVGKNDDTEIKLTLGSTTAYVDGEATTLTVPAKSIDGRTMVPVRFISEALGNDVTWNSETQTVEIRTIPYIEELDYNSLNIKPEEKAFLTKMSAFIDAYDNIGSNDELTDAQWDALYKDGMNNLTKIEGELKAIKLPEGSKLSDVSKETFEYINVSKECIRMYDNQESDSDKIEEKNLAAYQKLSEAVFTFLDSLE